MARGSSKTTLLTKVAFAAPKPTLGALTISQPPTHATVRRRWPADPGAPGGRSNRVGFDYDAYVPGEIAGWEPEIPAALATDVGRVDGALRDLAHDERGVSSLLWPLLRTEAIASSRIEGLVVSHHRLALALAGVDPGRDALAASVLGNLDALRRALDLAESPITIDAIRAIHRALLEGTADAGIAGQLRTSQVWIGGRHPNPRGAAFIPPPEGEVERLLDDLCRFCERDDLPPLVQAAVAHVQFETIHPFADGNGRVGRALIHAVLGRRGLTRRGRGSPPTLPPVSLVLSSRGDAYIAGLSAFRSGRHEEWLEFFLDAAYRATAVADALFHDVVALQERWSRATGRLRRGSAAETLIRRLPESPVIDLTTAVSLTNASREATRRAIDRLESSGVLVELTGKGRLRRWEAVGLFAILDDREALFRAGVGSRRTSPARAERR